MMLVGFSLPVCVALFPTKSVRHVMFAVPLPGPASDLAQCELASTFKICYQASGELQTADFLRKQTLRSCMRFGPPVAVRHNLDVLA